MNERVEWAEEIERELGDADAPPQHTRDQTIVTEADGWTVTTEAGWTFSIDKAAIPWGLEVSEPQPGDDLIVYAVGGEVIGVDLRGERLYLRSEREFNLKWLLFRASLRRERREQFARSKEKLDAQYEALPSVLKARIDRFREKDSDFRVEGEAYEMAAVADAPKIARAIAEKRGAGPDGYPVDLSEDEAETLVREFRDLDYAKQKELVPDLNDGHSGNTFGAATMLAYRLLTGQPC